MVGKKSIILVSMVLTVLLIGKGLVYGDSANTGYTITNISDNLWLSRDGGKAVRVKTGDFINKVGDYVIMDKTNGEITRFSLPNQTFGAITDEQTYKDVLYQKIRSIEKEFILEVPVTVVPVSRIGGILRDIQFDSPYFYLTEWKINQLAPGKYQYFISYAIEDIEEYEEQTEMARWYLDSIVDSKGLHMGEEFLEKQLFMWVLLNTTYVKNTDSEYGYYFSHLFQSRSLSNELICDGYARTVMYLFNSIGIPTTLIFGAVGDVNHAWNVVELSDGGRYHVDATLSDKNPLIPNVNFKYYNKTDAEVERTLSWDRSAYEPCNGAVKN
jgi:hypothetical protein